MHKSTFSSIVIWLSENANEDFNEDVNSHLTFAWIGYYREIKQLFIQLNNEPSEVSSKLITEFRYDFADTIKKMLLITDQNKVQNMLATVELFICGVIIKFDKD